MIQLEAEMNRQDVDPAWSAKATEQINKAAAESQNEFGPATGGQGVYVLTPQCRTTLCRVEFTLTNPEEMGNFVEQFLSHLGWNGQAHIHRPTSLMTTVYLLRDYDERPKSK